MNANDLDLIDWSDPLADHPLNKGLMFWLYGGAPGFRSEKVWSIAKPTITGTLEPDVDDGPQWVFDRRWGMRFDGTDDYVDCGNTAAIQLSLGTIAVWFRTSNAGSGFRAIAIKSRAYGMFLVDNSLAIYDWGSNTLRDTGINCADDHWHFAAASFRSGVTSGTIVFLDGNIALTTTMSVSVQTDTLRLGHNESAGSGAQLFSGLTSDLLIYNVPKSPAEIIALYQAGLEGYPDMLRRVGHDVAFKRSGNPMNYYQQQQAAA